MAPILSFTAEELWKVLTKEESVFFTTWHELPRPTDATQLLAKWGRLRELRDPVRKEIESLRAAGKVGSSLQTEVHFGASGDDHELLASLDDELKFLLLTFAARLAKSDQLDVRVSESAHSKCERCWHYRADVNDEALCGRCQSNLRGPGEARRHV
jgi:isoleucyl-tRNA synthetase